MKKLLGIVFAASALGTMAFAQDSLGVHLKVGYEFGSSFRLNNGKNGNLNGPVVGIDVPFTKEKGFQLSFSPSVVFAGALGHGGDTDGRIYRFTLSGQQAINKAVYFRIEAGFAHTEARGNQFDDVDDFIGGATVGFRLNKLPSIVHRFEPTLEVGGYISQRRQLNGVMIGLNFGF